MVHHAHASFASVNVSIESGSLVVTVADNGHGFSHQESPGFVDPEVFNSQGRKEGRGRGLKNMQARARLLGGSIQFESKKDAGTRVRLSIPLGINLTS